MKAIQSRIILALLLMVSGACLWSTYKDYFSATVQYKVLNEINSKTNLKRENYELLSALDKSYPNLSVTTLPLYTLQAFYDLAFGNTKDALYNAIRAKDINPYLMFNESVLSDIYKKMGVKDSAQYYASYAYKNIPGNGKHFLQYANMLIEQKDIPKLMEEFFNSPFKDNPIFIKVFLGAVVDKEIISKRIDDLALGQIHNVNHPDLRILCFYWLIGEQETKQALEINRQAASDFQSGKYIQAIEKFEKAISINPYDYLNYENLGMALIKSQQFARAKESFEAVITQDKAPKAKSYYGLGYAALLLGEKNIACDNFLKSSLLEYSEATKIYNRNCR